MKNLYSATYANWIASRRLVSMSFFCLQNRWVLSFFLKAWWFPSVRILVGKAFHSRGPWTANLWSPLDLYLALGISSRFWFVDRRMRFGLWVFIVSHRYWGVFPWKHLCVRQSALNVILSFTGSQWRDLSEKEIDSHGFFQSLIERPNFERLADEWFGIWEVLNKVH